MSRFRVSLSKRRPPCPLCQAEPTAVTRLVTTGSRVGYTIYPTRHARWCRSRLFGSQVPAGFPYAPGEYSDDRRAS